MRAAFVYPQVVGLTGASMTTGKGPICWVLGALLWSVCTPGAANADDRMRRLAAGETLVSTVEVAGAPLPRARVEAVIDAEPKDVWAVVSDCGRFSKTMPNVKDSKLVKRVGPKVFCRTVADLPFPLPDLVAETEALHEVEGAHYRRRWWLLKGDFERNEGLWDVRPFGDKGGRSLVRYEILAVPRVAVPDVLQALAQKTSLPGLMKRLRKEVKRRRP